MDKVVWVITLCLIFVGANCQLSCLQGIQAQISGGVSIPGVNTTLQAQSCPNDGQIYNCQRFDITSTLSSVATTTQVALALCVPASACSLVDCSNVTTILAQTMSGLTIDSCCVYCCSTDNCNDKAETPMNGMCVGGGAASFAHKLWVMVLAGILTVATVSQLH